MRPDPIFQKQQLSNPSRKVITTPPTAFNMSNASSGNLNTAILSK